MSSRILLVEDEPGLVLTLSDLLTAEGYEVDSAGDGPTGLSKALQGGHDLLILDVMLPGMNGFDVCRSLRQQGKDIGILMLTAKTQVTDRVVGLKLGADDYLAKPFGPRELLARVRAVLRRGGEAAPAAHEAFCFGPYRLDLESRVLQGPAGEVPLTGGEFELLRLFASRPNHVLSRDHLVTLMKGYERGPFDRSVDVRVARLRRKIEPDPEAPVYLRTIWGQGYLFSPGGKARP